jgi:L-ascorbate metabolism protein UlaG (beta-lactamase superfamily)
MKKYQGPATDHFNGEFFFNPDHEQLRGVGSAFQWLKNRQPGPWKKWTDSGPGLTPPERVTGGNLRVTFVGHSSVLIQMDGLNILCDPVWSMRASPVPFAGPKRHRPPGIRFDQLPTIDLVLQSHDHYDHFDVPTYRKIAAAKWGTKYAVPLGVADRLISKRLAAVRAISELDWGDSVQISSHVRVTAVPALHFSGRGLRDRNRTLWCGYVVEGPSGRVYFAGDTAYGTHFRQIAERFPQVRLALIPIGAYRPQWFMGPVHISPQDAVKAHEDLGASTSVAIHFGTFRLADDGEDEPVNELRKELNTRKVEHRFWTLEPGEGREVP